MRGMRESTLHGFARVVKTPPPTGPRCKTDIQEALALPLSQNVYYRNLPDEIQKALGGRFFQALEPLQAAGQRARCISSSHRG